MDKEEIFQFRFIKANGNVYIRKEDVIRYLQEIASTQENDTRDSIINAANEVRKLGNVATPNPD
jgi:hypothetical protein